MPRPPMLPTIDWSDLFAKGVDFTAWLDAAEDPARADRMRDGYETQTIPADVAGTLAALPKPVHVIAIAEDWCGDVIRHAPVLQKLADASAGNVRVSYIARDTDLDVFARFLTNGGEAIPKFVFLSDQFVETGNWGPMPNNCRELIAAGKAMGNTGKARKLTSALYNADPGKAIVVEELLHRIRIAATADLITPE